MKKRTALLMAFKKTDKFLAFAKELFDLGWSLIGSKGTAEFLQGNGIECRDIAEFVGAPILGHKVVSISREIAAALLANDSPEEVAELERIGVPRINLVYINFYPLDEEIANPAHTLASVIDKTDIGGPTMVRAAAKGRRIVLCNERDIDSALPVLRNSDFDAPERADTLNILVSYLVIRAELLVAKYCNASAEFHKEEYSKLGSTEKMHTD